MNTISELIGPLYQKLLEICSKYDISLNLDIQDPSLSFDDLTQVRDFLYAQLKRALENCQPGDTITIAEQHNDKQVRFTVKDSGKSLTKEQQQELRDQDLEVRARYGYDNIVTIKFDIV
jgi:K+-sensing histidine kinase KdpD